MPLWKLRGRVEAGQTWVTNNWKRIVVAHSRDLPDIADDVRGTLNIQLAERWYPPDDEKHRRESHKRGVSGGLKEETGADFLANGNYIHPEVWVCSIGGKPVEGRLDFAGVGKEVWEVDGNVWGTIAPSNGSRFSRRRIFGLCSGSAPRMNLRWRSF